MMLLTWGVACWTPNPGQIPVQQAMSIPILIEEHQHSHVEINAYIRAGSAYDPIGQEGLANLAKMCVPVCVECARRAAPNEFAETVRSHSPTGVATRLHSRRSCRR